MRRSLLGPEQQRKKKKERKKEEKMPTDQASANGASASAEGQDTTVQITHGEHPEQRELRHGTSSEMTPSDTEHRPKRLATDAQVDETEDGRVDASRSRSGKDGAQTGQSPEQDQSDSNADGHPRDSEAGADVKSRDLPDNNVKVGDVGGKPSSGDTSAHPVHTRLNQEVVDKDGKATARAVVNALDSESGNNSPPKEESRPEKDSNQLPEAGASAGHGHEQVVTKTDQKETKALEDGSTVKTPRGTSGKPNTAKQGKKDYSRETDPRNGKRTPSAASKSPRTGDSRVHRALMEKNQKKDDKADKNEEKQRNAQAKTSVKPGTPVSRPADNRENKTSESKLPVGKLAQSTDPSDARPTTTDTTDKPSSESSVSKPDTEIKPANGMVQDGGREKGKEPEVKEHKKEEGKEQHQKARALLSRTVMRRMTSLENKPSNQTSSPQPNTTDLNSSAGSKSLGSAKSPSPVPSQGRIAHKTQSMQSLAVPAPGIGPSPMEADDKESLGSRRDSVRQSLDSSSRKSVDYRLQASQTVVTAGPVEEKPKSVWHDDSMIRAAIPALPVPLAVFCLVLNIVLPGSGEFFLSDQLVCASSSSSLYAVDRTLRSKN